METRRNVVGAGVLLMMCAVLIVDVAAAEETVSKEESLPVIKPWKIIVQDKDYNGAWTVAGDLTGDGKAELVYVRILMKYKDNIGGRNPSYIASAIGCTLDNKILWKWGDPKGKRARLFGDAPCKIYDWDNDGKNEVILLTKQDGKTWLVELNGATGKEKRRFEIPNESTDCITFCNLTGPPNGHPKDVIVKNRYLQVWVYNYDGQQLWTANMPGGHEVSHQARPFDLNNDGIDEVSLGCTMADKNGKILWITKKNGKTIGHHVDCVRLVKPAAALEDIRLAITYCGDPGSVNERIAMINGTGNILWDKTGRHFESIDIGKVRSDIPGKQIIVDIAHTPRGKPSPLWILDENGNKLAEIITNISRIHRLINWFGGDVDSIVIAEDDCLYDGYGKKQAIFDTPIPKGVKLPEGKNVGKTCFVGDMTGDGIPDIVIYTNPGKLIYIYKNEKGKKPEGGSHIGTKVNFTLY